MKIPRIFAFLLLFTLLFRPVFTISAAAEAPGFHIGTYYYEGFTEPIEEVIDFDKLTHICYAFIIPREDGSLKDLLYPEKLAQLTELAHARDVKVLISIGGFADQGAPLEPVFESLAASAATRRRLVDEVMDLVAAYDLDGVDIDWEYPRPHSAANYEQLIQDFYERTSVQDLLLGIAATGHASGDQESEINSSVSDTALEKLDLIHIMCYDLSSQTGHSPMWFARASLDYWGERRSVPREKLVLGVPFYARPSWKLYKDIVAEKPSLAFHDYVLADDANTLDSFYDSIGTMKQKTALAMEKGGGIFSWEINMDSRGSLSLLDTIHRTIVTHREVGASQFATFVTIAYNDKEIVCDSSYGYAFVDSNGRTLIPVRIAAEQMGINVDYNDTSRTATVTKNSTVMTIPLDGRIIYINGQPLEMDTAAVTLNGRVYLPMRVLFENLDCTVTWLEGPRTVLVYPAE